MAVSEVAEQGFTAKMRETEVRREKHGCKRGGRARIYSQNVR